eukprot:m.324017 g.324017  ORF g.324017 m.324017 type:complete len:308 (+) comp20366_c0_seq1:370-1293(+)
MFSCVHHINSTACSSCTSALFCASAALCQSFSEKQCTHAESVRCPVSTCRAQSSGPCGICIKLVMASAGAMRPAIMAATCSIMGSSNPTLFASCAAALAVGTPSATSFMDAMISSSFSPCPSRTPTVRFREAPPKQVSMRSPMPDSPARVASFAPKATASFFISLHPRVMIIAAVLYWNPMPLAIPHAMAKTFLMAPPTSTPITSGEVYTRTVSEPSSTWMRCASGSFSLAITSPVACPSINSRANDGPDRNAVGCSGCFSALRITSHMNVRSSKYIPFDSDTTGISTVMTSCKSARTSREACTGIA